MSAIHNFAKDVLLSAELASEKLDEVSKAIPTYPDNGFFAVTEWVSYYAGKFSDISHMADELGIESIASWSKTIKAKLYLCSLALMSTPNYHDDITEVLADTQSNIEELSDVALKISNENKKPQLYLIEFEHGQTIKAAESFAEAYDKATRIAASKDCAIESVKLADNEDISWFLSMGGTLPII